MSTVIYILALIFVMFIGMQLLVRLRGRFQRGKSVPAIPGEIGERLRGKEKILAYFYSPTCSACQVQEKHLEQVQTQFSNIIRINVAQHMEIARVFGIMGTPTTIIIENQTILHYFVGVASPAKLLRALQ